MKRHDYYFECDSTGNPYLVVKDFNNGQLEYEKRIRLSKEFKQQSNSAYGKVVSDTTIKNKKENLNFGEALEAIKDGMKASRAGWNGKKQFIELATCISYVNMRNDHIHVMHKDIGNNAIAFIGTSGIQVGWLASQADMLANDWYIFE